MNNKLQTYITSDMISNLPEELVRKYGWILLATPAICYGIDTFRDFAESVMAKNYRLHLKIDDFECTLEQQPYVS